jgi:hypothetical protein
MRDRWQPVGILAGVLFLINVVARFIVWQFLSKPSDNDHTQITVGLVGLGLIAAVLAWAGYRWATRYPTSRASGDLGAAIAVACLLTVLVGPFAGGSVPFKEGAGFFFGEIWQYLAFAGGGAILGSLVAIMLGRDYRSRALKRYTQRSAAKPRRVVRR